MRQPTAFSMGIVLYLLSAIVLFSQAKSDDNRSKTIEEMKVEADEVVALMPTDNVSAAKDSSFVFNYANELRRVRSFEEAKYYYTKGLQLSPWNMDGQLSLSQTLFELRNLDESKRIAEIVFENSEREELLAKAASLSGLKMPEEVPVLPAGRIDKTVYCFVPIGEVESWLLSVAAEKLRRTLGVESYVYPGVLPLPQAHRSFYDRWGKRLREGVNWDHPWIQIQMRDLRVKDAESASVEQLLEIIARIEVERGKEDPRSDFSRLKKDARSRDKQWDANILIEILKEKVPKRENVVFVGITEGDIYKQGNNFMFSLALRNKPYCVLSYRRFQYDFQRERENKARLTNRLHKQLLSATGFCFGIPRPTDPRSARSYPNSLDDHDLKESWLSPECIAGFEKGFGWKLPEEALAATKAAMSR